MKSKAHHIKSKRGKGDFLLHLGWLERLALIVPLIIGGWLLVWWAI